MLTDVAIFAPSKYYSVAHGLRTKTFEYPNSNNTAVSFNPCLYTRYANAKYKRVYLVNSRVLFTIRFACLASS